MQLCEKYTNNPSELTHCDWFIRLLPELYSSRNVYHIVIHYTHFKEQSYINNDRLFPRALNFFPSPRMRSHAQPHIQKASPPSKITTVRRNMYLQMRHCWPQIMGRCAGHEEGIKLWLWTDAFGVWSTIELLTVDIFHRLILWRIFHFPWAQKISVLFGDDESWHRP